MKKKVPSKKEVVQVLRDAESKIRVQAAEIKLSRIEIRGLKEKLKEQCDKNLTLVHALNKEEANAVENAQVHADSAYKIGLLDSEVRRLQALVDGYRLTLNKQAQEGAFSLLWRGLKKLLWSNKK